MRCAFRLTGLATWQLSPLASYGYLSSDSNPPNRMISLNIIVDFLGKHCTSPDLYALEGSPPSQPWSSLSQSTNSCNFLLLYISIGMPFCIYLFRKRDEFLLCEEPLPFHVACSGEGPAATAHSLILHSSHSPVLSPVECLRQCVLHINSLCFEVGHSVWNDRLFPLVGQIDLQNSSISSIRLIWRLQACQEFEFSDTGRIK